MTTMQTIAAVSAVWAGLDLFVLGVLIARPERSHRRDAMEQLALNVEARRAAYAEKINPSRDPLTGRYVSAKVL